MKQDNVYKTKDIFEAAWLHSEQAKLLLLEPNGKYFWFVFDDLSKCQKLSSSYWSQTAKGDVKAFVNSLKTLKDLIFSRKESSW